MKLYNTLSRKKEEFKPIEEGKVKMYVCGPTVYNFIHIGNARPFIIFDTLRRYLEYRGYDVTFVQNFTDVDDKIIKRSHEENITPEEVATKYIKEYFVDADGLGIKRASVHPQVTDNIEQIIAFVKELEDKGYAYAVNGDVYFDTKKFKDYGKLSGDVYKRQVFHTDTKKDATSLTMAQLKEISEEVSIPVVAIGGISIDNALELKGTGVDGICVISAIFGSENPSEATKKLLDLSKQIISK